MPDDPTDYQQYDTARFIREMAITSSVHGAYMRQLVDDGFTRDEAFTLVRDAHYLYTRGAFAPDSDLPEWLTSQQTSPESSPSIEGVLLPLKRPTPEQ